MTQQIVCDTCQKTTDPDNLLAPFSHWLSVSRPAVDASHFCSTRCLAAWANQCVAKTVEAS